MLCGHAGIGKGRQGSEGREGSGDVIVMRGRGAEGKVVGLPHLLQMISAFSDMRPWKLPESAAWVELTLEWMIPSEGLLYCTVG